MATIKLAKSLENQQPNSLLQFSPVIRPKI